MYGKDRFEYDAVFAQAAIEGIPDVCAYIDDILPSGRIRGRITFQHFSEFYLVWRRKGSVSIL